MKNIKKIISVCAVLSISATAALSAISFAGCDTANEVNAPEKLITVDKNHSATTVSTARGAVQTKSSGKVYYVSPEGDRENDGSSWDKTLPIDYLLRSESIKLAAGDTVYVKPGTYSITSMVTVPETITGAYNSYIRIVNAALEKEQSGYTGAETLATLDFSKMYFGSAERGVQIYGSYIYWYGIDVCGAGDNGLYIGGNYNTIEYCEFYNNRDTGLQLGRSESGKTTIDQWPSYNLIKNCTSHNNYDNETYGENADGFAAKLTVGYGNVFDGCIAYRNSDDGWDLFAKSDSGNIGCVIIYNCVAFENGYLEYTQAENNARFENFNKAYTETFKETDDKRYFRTRDGDGNGFKLGGSVMEGDVVMYNCLSYLNRMHGVTDNSNPGYLKVEGVTSYDNSAAVDDNPESKTFGQIVAKANHDKHGNINVSRQTYSYNSVINTLSVKSPYAKSLEADEYRGSVTDSLLVGDGVAYEIKGSMDADSKIGKAGSPRAELVATDVFKQLPFTVGEGNAHSYNLSGLHDLYQSGTGGALKADRVHITYRNADGSINMKDILAKKDGIDDSLIAGKNLGSTLNLSKWEDYTHFFAKDFVNASAAAENAARLDRAIETLTINTDKNAVYQDFEVPLKMYGCTIEWASSNPDLAEIGTDVEISGSDSQYIDVLVYRPLNADGKVTLTATITCGTGDNKAVGNKEFELTIKSGKPTVGAIKVRTPKGEILKDGGSYVLDQYAVFTEPELLVENGIDYNGKLLKPDQYEASTVYEYATDKNAPFVEIKGFTPSNAGVYKVTKTVTLKSDPSNKSVMSYTVFVSSSTATVDFAGASSVTVNKNGYRIAGNLSNATGRIYALSSAAELDITKENIKTAEGVKSYEFRNDKIAFTFDNANSAAYNVYYALANLNGEVTSEVYSARIGVTEISTAADFAKIAGGGKIGEEAPETTIYLLTDDLDFNGSYSSGTSEFKGLLNGAGHTVKNVKVTGGDKAGVFTKLAGGTIENIKFENITISGNKQTGLIAQTYDGYLHSIAIKNIKVTGGERTGGLVGQAFEGTLNISQVSVVNDNETDYVISSGQAKRAGGLIGLIQASNSPASNSIINITDCYVNAKIFGSEQVAGMVGAQDNAKTNIDYKLKINRCYFGGTAESTYTTPRVGGMIGYQSSNVGNFEITNCISVGKLINQGNHILVPLKTASLIVGGFSSAAINYVEGCISIMEEYNSDYGVEPYPVSRLVESVAEIEELLGDAYDGWTFIFEDGSDEVLKAPYLTLNFLN